MIRGFLALLFAGLMAWVVSPYLSDIALFGLASVAAIAEFLVPHDLEQKEGDFYAEFFIWWILIWLGRKPLMGIFGWLVPRSRRYGETKLIRRIQSVSFELCVIALVASVIAAATMFIPPVGKTPKRQTVESYGLLDEIKTSPDEWVNTREGFDPAAPDFELEAQNRLFQIYLLNQLTDERVKSSFISGPFYEKSFGVYYTLPNQARIRVDRVTETLKAPKPNQSPEEEHSTHTDYSKTPAYRYPSGNEISNAFSLLGTSFRIEKEFTFTTVARENNSSSKTKTINTVKKARVDQPPPGLHLTPEEKYQGSINKILDELQEPCDSFISDYLNYLESGELPVFTILESRSDSERFDSLLENQSIPKQAKVYFVLWYHTLTYHFWTYAFVGTFFGLCISFGCKPSMAAFYLPILNFFDKGRMGFGGSARFAGYIEEWRYFWEENRKGLFLGKSIYNPFVDLYMQDKRHMLTLAGTRGGKGVSAIIPNLLRWRGSCVVIDPKGANAAVTARKRREMGQNVYIINPFGAQAAGLNADSFDPFEGFDVDSSSIHRDIDFVVDAIVMAQGKNKDGDHWIEGAKTILRGFIAQILTDHEKPSLAQLRGLFSLDEDEKTTLYAEMALNERAGNIAKEAAARIMDGIATDEIQNIISNANAQTEWLRSGDIQSCLSSEPSFSFSELKERPTTVYLVIPPEEIKRNARFIRLFINMLIREVYHGEISQTPILTIMDEFPELGRMEEVVSVFAVAAGYNLTLWPFAQSLQQLNKFYKDDIDTIVGNCRAVQVFNVTDPMTTEFVSKRLGARSTMTSSETTSSTNAVPLRGADDVAKEIGEGSDVQYILRAGQAPLLLQKAPYFKVPLWRKLLNTLFNEYPSLKVKLEKFAPIKPDYDPDPTHID